MCGIVGLVGRPLDVGDLRRMSSALTHRGPDDSGEFVDHEAGVALAMRRLSILDIEGGQQPMSNEDGTISIVFNGELFNAPELRNRLLAQGRRFSTSHSDTECMLRLYEHWGEEMVSHLNGMYAFVVHDRRRGVVFGARDRFGIKPLYIAEAAGHLAFASELKALLPLSWIGRELDQQSFHHYLSLRFVPGERSILRGVRRVAPGSSFRYEVSEGRLTTRRFWRPHWTSADGVPVEEWAERVRDALRQAVRRWVWSDVPVACSLSGGLDSTSIVGVLGELGGPPLKTYSVGFRGPGEAEWDESKLARRVAERWGADHQELILTPEALLDDLVSMVWALDEPYGGGLPSWYVFRFMAGDVKVGLTGTGGDELFGNYAKWRPWEQSRLWQGGPHHWIRWLAARLPAGLLGASRAASMRASFGPFDRPSDAYPLYLSDAFKRQYVEAGDADAIRDTRDWLDALYRDTGTDDARDGFASIDMATQLPDEFLAMTDRFSMAHSLEARTPFLDADLVDEVMRVPSHIRTNPRDPKHLLRRAVSGLLPDEVLHAPKRGFVLPDDIWLRGPLRPLVERLLGPERLLKQGLFRPGLFAERVAPCLDGRSGPTGEIWTLLMFQLWHAVYVDARSSEAPGWSWRDLV